MIFKDLTLKEKVEFQQSARTNYQAGQKIEYEIWHPVYCAECEAINREALPFPTDTQARQLSAIKSALIADSDKYLNEIGRIITPVQLMLLINAMDRALNDQAETVDNLAGLLVQHSELSENLDIAEYLKLM